MRTFSNESIRHAGPRAPNRRESLVNKRAFFQTLTDHNRALARLHGPGLTPEVTNNLVVFIPKVAVRNDEVILLGRSAMDRGVQVAIFLALPAPEDEGAYQRYCDPHLQNGWSAFIVDRDRKLQSHPWDFGAPEESLRRLLDTSLDDRERPAWLDRFSRGRCRLQALPR